MKNSQEDRLTMYLSFSDFLIKNAAILKDLPNYNAYFEELQKIITEIKSFAERQKDDRTGLTKEKKELRDKLISITLDSSLKLNAYAEDSNKTKLRSAVKMTKSKLLRATDTGLRDYAKLIHGKAQDNLDGLVNYGITVASQTALLDTINSYFISIPAPRDGIMDRKEATTRLAELLNNADSVISRIDARIGIIKVAQPTFYKSYINAKKIVDTGKSPLVLKASAIDIKNQLPIKGVKFSFVNSEASLQGIGDNTEIVKKTADKGRFIIKSMPEGTYKVNVSKTGYKEKVVMVNVIPGELADLRVELERV